MTAGGPEPFTVDAWEDAQGSWTVRVAGELDLATGPVLEARLLETVGRARKVVVDLVGCTFFSSTGLNLLVRAAQAQNGRGLTIAIMRGGPVARVLELTGTRGFFDVVELQPAGDVPADR